MGKVLERLTEKEVKKKIEFINHINVGESCNEIFLTKDELPEMDGFGLQMAGIAQLKPPYHIERNCPQEHSVLITQSGEGLLEWEEGEKVIEPNSLVVLPAGKSFRFTIKGEHWDLCWLLLHDEHEFLKQKAFSKRVYPCSDAENIRLVFSLLALERQKSSLFRVTSLVQLFRYLKQNLSQEQQIAETRLDQAFTKVEQALHQAWNVSSIADLCHYSEPHLYRLCKQQYGMGPKQKLQEMRIEKAKQLLIDTQWPINELAQRLGFSDPHNFSNFFKKFVGVSPKGYRG
ncbi:MAG: helix-turn-helix transcriptional regulator [Psychromonas sp.]